MNYYFTLKTEPATEASRSLRPEGTAALSLKVEVLTGKLNRGDY